MLPLEGLLVLDLAQYLAGPSAALRLSDLGARVVKVERPDGGKGGRRLGLAGESPNDDSLLFNDQPRQGPVEFAAPPRGVTANLGDAAGRERLLALVREADVLIHSFRPGALSRFGLDFESVAALSPWLVYAHVTGYGDSDWRDLPGQDLLVQARSGLVWRNGRAGGPPEPFRLSVSGSPKQFARMSGSRPSCRKISTVRGLMPRRRPDGGCLSGAGRPRLPGPAFGDRPRRAGRGEPVRGRDGPAVRGLHGPSQRRRAAAAKLGVAGHPYLGAPYGIYQTSDGWVALAMGSLEQLDGRALARTELGPSLGHSRT